MYCLWRSASRSSCCRARRRESSGPSAASGSSMVTTRCDATLPQTWRSRVIQTTTRPPTIRRSQHSLFGRWRCP
eukprot:6882119-Prymnesium_polylepis.1